MGHMDHTHTLTHQSMCSFIFRCSMPCGTPDLFTAAKDCIPSSKDSWCIFPNYEQLSYRGEVGGVSESEAGCGSILSIKTASVLVFPACQTVAIPHVHRIFKLPVS